MEVVLFAEGTLRQTRWAPHGLVWSGTSWISMSSDRAHLGRAVGTPSSSAGSDCSKKNILRPNVLSKSQLILIIQAPTRALKETFCLLTLTTWLVSVKPLCAFGSAVKTPCQRKQPSASCHRWCAPDANAQLQQKGAAFVAGGGFCEVRLPRFTFAHL